MIGLKYLIIGSLILPSISSLANRKPIHVNGEYTKVEPSKVENSIIEYNKSIYAADFVRNASELEVAVGGDMTKLVNPASITTGHLLNRAIKLTEEENKKQALIRLKHTLNHSADRFRPELGSSNTPTRTQEIREQSNSMDISGKTAIIESNLVKVEKEVNGVKQEVLLNRDAYFELSKASKKANEKIKLKIDSVNKRLGILGNSISNLKEDLGDDLNTVHRDLNFLMRSEFKGMTPIQTLKNLEKNPHLKTLFSEDKIKMLKLEADKQLLSESFDDFFSTANELGTIAMGLNTLMGGSNEVLSKVVNTVQVGQKLVGAALGFSVNPIGSIAAVMGIVGGGGGSPMGGAVKQILANQKRMLNSLSRIEKRQEFVLENQERIIEGQKRLAELSFRLYTNLRTSIDFHFDKQNLAIRNLKESVDAIHEISLGEAFEQFVFCHNFNKDMRSTNSIEANKAGFSYRSLKLCANGLLELVNGSSERLFKASVLVDSDLSQYEFHSSTNAKGRLDRISTEQIYHVLKDILLKTFTKENDSLTRNEILKLSSNANSLSDIDSLSQELKTEDILVINKLLESYRDPILVFGVYTDLLKVLKKKGDIVLKLTDLSLEKIYRTLRNMVIAVQIQQNLINGVYLSELMLSVDFHLPNFTLKSVTSRSDEILLPQLGYDSNFSKNLLKKYLLKEKLYNCSPYAKAEFDNRVSEYLTKKAASYLAINLDYSTNAQVFQNYWGVNSPTTRYRKSEWNYAKNGTENLAANIGGIMIPLLPVKELCGSNVFDSSISSDLHILRLNVEKELVLIKR